MTKSEYQELAEFIGARFDRNDRRFDAVDERFETIDRRFDAVDLRFETIDRRFDAVDERFENIDRRFDAMDERLSRVEIFEEENRHQIQILAEAVSGHDRKLDAFRAEVAVGFQDLQDLVRTSYAHLDRRVTRLEEWRDRG